MDIYIRRGEEQFGPLTPEQLQEGLNNGTLQADDLAWHGELPDWVSAGELLQKVAGAAAAPELAEPVAEIGPGTAAASGGRKKLLVAVAAGVVLLGGVAAAYFAGVFGGGEEPAPVNPPTIADGGGNTGGTGNPAGTVNPPIPAPAGGGSTSFAAVTQKLDSGGSFYFYLSTDQAQGWVQSAFAEGGNLLKQMGAGLGGVEAAQAEMALGIGQAVYGGLGLDSIDGLGASTKDLGGGLKRNVAVMHHDPAKGEGLIWKAFGTAPHELGALKLMPADTAYAVHGDLDLKTVLQWVQQLTTQHAPPEIAGQVNSELQNPMLQAVLDGYAGEVGLYVTLDPEKTIPVPLGGMAVGGEDLPAVIEVEPTEEGVPVPPPGLSPPPGLPQPGVLPGAVPPPAGVPVPPLPPGTFVPLPLPPGGLDGAPGMVNIPEPGLVLVLKVADDSIEKMIEGLVGTQVALERVIEGAVTIKQTPAPLPLPFPVSVQPALCQVGDYLIVATSPALAKKVIAVHSGQDSGLQGTPEFQKLAQGMDLKGNQISYMSERVGKLYEQAVKQMLSSGPGNDLPPPVENLVLKLMTMGVSSAMAVTQVQADGFVIQSHTSGMGYDTMALVGVAVVPVAVGMATVLPAMARSQLEGDVNEAVMQEEMLNKARRVGTALIHHANVNGQFPNSETWTDDVMKIVNDADAFVNPMFVDPEAPNEKICVWLYNPKLSGVKLEDITDKRNTVLMYDGGLEWNGTAGEESFMPEEFFKITTVFVDGRVEVIGPGEGDHVKWNP